MEGRLHAERRDDHYHGVEEVSAVGESTEGQEGAVGKQFIDGRCEAPVTRDHHPHEGETPRGVTDTDINRGLRNGENAVPSAKHQQELNDNGADPHGDVQKEGDLRGFRPFGQDESTGHS